LLSLETIKAAETFLIIVSTPVSIIREAKPHHTLKVLASQAFPDLAKLLIV
jgi:hypothetical protein